MLASLVATAALAAVPRVASYDITAELLPAEHRVVATERVRWTNPAPAPAGELWFHLYLNAFSSDRTTFFRESGGRHRSHQAVADAWGWVAVRRIAIVGGPDLTASMEFISPDDGNPDDRTVARVALPAPIAPGGTIELEIAFTSQLPGVFARTGYVRDFHLLGQWFPKLGVFEDDGSGRVAWNCHQFHLNSEFYADFGDYRVALTVPDGWTVGGTGTVVGREKADGKVTVTLSQEAVHDFAVVASPRLAEASGTFEDKDVPPPWRLHAAKLLHLTPEVLHLPRVDIRVLTPPDLLPLVERQMTAARAAIAHYGLYYGPYPYGHLTILVPPIGAGGAGGMEYPTFITSSGSWRDLLPPFSWRQTPEVVTVHEFGHQYFYGMLASNEFEHAWMDEGINTYAEIRTMEAFRSDIASTPALPPLLSPQTWELSRLGLLVFRPVEPIDRPAWDFSTTGQYFFAAYDHPALVLATFENLVGASAFARGMRAYAERFQFHHPRPDDLFAALAEHAPADAVALLRSALESSPPCDYAVASVRSRRQSPPEGTMAPDPGSTTPPSWPEAASEPGGAWSSDVVVTRIGELVFPVEIELRFADGSRRRVVWDGRDRFRRIHEESAERLTAAVVDPDNVLLLDRDRTNNGRLTEPANTSLRAKAGVELLGILALLTALVGSVL